RLPLVVAVSGINGTLDDKLTLSILQSLYETGDFHVMHVESPTSVNHQVRNHQFFLGGFPEGLLLYKTIEELRHQPDHADQIEQVLVLGMSFGGLVWCIGANCGVVLPAGEMDGAVLAFSPPLDLKVLFQNLAVASLVHEPFHKTYLENGCERYTR